MLRKVVALSLDVALLLVLLFPVSYAAVYSHVAYLKMALATRSGPGTCYDEPGTFFISNYTETCIFLMQNLSCLT